MEDIKEALNSWLALNKFIMAATEAECQALLKYELRSKRRKQFVLRIHSRINWLRAHREREELLKKVAK